MPSVNACAYRAICYTLSTLGLLLTMHVMTEELEVYFHLGDLHSEVYEHKPKNMQAGINWPHYVNTQQGRHVHPETTLRKVTWQLRMSTISCSILIMHHPGLEPEYYLQTQVCMTCALPIAPQKPAPSLRNLEVLEGTSQHESLKPNCQTSCKYPPRSIVLLQQRAF